MCVDFAVCVYYKLKHEAIDYAQTLDLSHRASTNQNAMIATETRTLPISGLPIKTMATTKSHAPDAERTAGSLHRDCSAATWKHKRGGKGDAAWQKWVSHELKAWVTWWKANPSVVHYGSNATYRGTMKATPDQAMHEIEMRQNESSSATATKAGAERKGSDE